MRKGDMTVPALLMEALMLLMAFVYIGLQIFYGLSYHVGMGRVLLNVLALLLVYAGLTLLSVYPERIHRLPDELFTPYVRKLSIRMIRLVKFIFVAGLLVPCVFDALGAEMPDADSLIVIGLMLAVVIYYEYKVIRTLRKKR